MSIELGVMSYELGVKSYIAICVLKTDDRCTFGEW